MNLEYTLSWRNRNVLKHQSACFHRFLMTVLKSELMATDCSFSKCRYLYSTYLILVEQLLNKCSIWHCVHQTNSFKLSHSWQLNCSSSSREIPCNLWNPAPLCYFFLSWSSWIQSMLPQHISVRYILNTTFPSTCRSSKQSRSFSHQNPG